MAKKTSNKKKPNRIHEQEETSSLLERLRELIGDSGTTFSGTTKFWVNNESRRCRKQPKYPQLAELTDYDNNEHFTRNICCWYGPPPPGLGNINTLLESASSRSYVIHWPSRNLACHLVLTKVSNPAFMVYTYSYYNREERQVITHKSTEIDPYDAYSQVMKFSYVIKSGDGKYYAISSQGALVMMEQVDDQQIIITGRCGTRAVPSSARAKLYTEYLFESKGEIFLVFLIYYKESVNKLADEIEVFRFDTHTLKLFRVYTLQERALFLEDDCCVWVDSKEVGCKGNSVYFTGVSGRNGEWRVYDMKTGSFSDGVYFTGVPGSNGNWRVFDMKNEYISDGSWEWIEII